MEGFLGLVLHLHGFNGDAVCDIGPLNRLLALGRIPQVFEEAGQELLEMPLDGLRLQ